MNLNPKTRLLVPAFILMLSGCLPDLSGFQMQEAPSTVDSEPTPEVPGPELTIDSPVAGTTLAGYKTLSGTCEDGDTISLTGEALGAPLATACASGVYSLSVKLTGAQGAKILTVKATNAEGRSTTKTHSVVMPKPALRGFNNYLPCGNNAGQYYWNSGYGRDGVDKLNIQRDMDYYSTKGMKLMRVAMDWEHMQPTLQGALTAWPLECIHFALDEAEARGMKIVLDLHNYGRYNNTIIGQPGVPKAALVDVWVRLATEFNAHPALFGYDIMNEPHDMNDDTLWPELAQMATGGIRTVDTVTPIIISGDHWSAGDSWKTSSNKDLNIIDPSDKIIYQAHVYFDEWGAGQYNKSYDDNMGTPDTGVDRVTPFVEWLHEKGFEGYVGEFGVPEANNPDQIYGDIRWYETLDRFMEYLTANGVHATVWAGGYMWIQYGQPNSWYNIQPIYPLVTGQPAPPPEDRVDRGQMSILQKYPSD